MSPKALYASTVAALVLAPALMAKSIPAPDDIEALSDYFFRLPAYDEVRVSPDCDAIAYTYNEDGQTGIRLIHFSADKGFDLQNGENVRVREFEWVDNEMLIYILQAEGRSHPQVNTITLDRFKRDEVIPAGERHRMRKGAMSIVDPLPVIEGKVLAWRGEQAGGELFMLNPRTDETPIVAPNDGTIAKWFNDDTGKLWMAARRNEDNGLADIYLRFDPEEREFHEIKSLRGSRTNVLSLSRDGKVALIASDLGGETIGMGQFNVQEGSLPGDLMRDERFDFSDVQPIYVPHLKAVIGAHVDLDTPRTYWFNPQLEQFQKLVDGSMPAGRYNEVIGFDPDGVTVFVRSFSDTFPGEFVKIDLKARKIDPLLRKRPWIDDTAMSSSRFVSIPTIGGESIHGYLTLPADKKENLPLIISLQVEPGKRAFHEFDPNAQFYTAQGFAHLVLMPRGSAGFGKSYQGGAESPRVFMARHVADDAAAAAKWAVDEGIARKGAIGITGSGGFGGFSAISCAVRHPAVFKAVASAARQYELRDVLNHDWDSDALGDDAFMKEFSPMERLDAVQAAVLLVDSPRGKTASAAEKLSNALRDAGKNVERKELPRDINRSDLPSILAKQYARFFRTQLVSE